MTIIIHPGRGIGKIEVSGLAGPLLVSWQQAEMHHHPGLEADKKDDGNRSEYFWFEP
jgi:hypothetical protein